MKEETFATIGKIVVVILGIILFLFIFSFGSWMLGAIFVGTLNFGDWISKKTNLPLSLSGILAFASVASLLVILGSIYQLLKHWVNKNKDSNE